MSPQVLRGGHGREAAGEEDEAPVTAPCLTDRSAQDRWFIQILPYTAIDLKEHATVLNFALYEKEIYL